MKFLFVNFYLLSILTFGNIDFAKRHESKSTRPRTGIVVLKCRKRSLNKYRARQAASLRERESKRRQGMRSGIDDFHHSSKGQPPCTKALWKPIPLTAQAGS